MRVLIINTSERIGGAAIAANRLMEALKNNGIKTKMLVPLPLVGSIRQVLHLICCLCWLNLWLFSYFYQIHSLSPPY